MKVKTIDHYHSLYRLMRCASAVIKDKEHKYYIYYVNKIRQYSGYYVAYKKSLREDEIIISTKR